MSSHPLPCHPNRLFAHTLAPRSPSGHANIALPLRVTSHRHATTHPHLCRPTVPAHSPAPLVFSSFVPLYHYVRTHALPRHTHVLRPPLMTPPARLAARPTAPPTHDRRTVSIVLYVPSPHTPIHVPSSLPTLANMQCLPCHIVRQKPCRTRPTGHARVIV